VPRKADAALEGRILDVAYRLWSKGGEEALTMRAVARAAGTTTPTLYERFKDKDDLLAFLRDRARQKMFSAVASANSPVERCRKALKFALTHGNEYRLFSADWAIRLGRKEPVPSFALLRDRLARDLGGTPQQHTQLALALVALVHGTAMLLLAEGIASKASKEVRQACLAACEALMNHAAQQQEYPIVSGESSYGDSTGKRRQRSTPSGA
jgi:AcrR family transcriptional regulator